MTAATLYRVPRRMFRKLIKPLALWLNAWRFKQSEDELHFLNAQHDGVIEMMRRENLRQVQLKMQRQQIGGW